MGDALVVIDRDTGDITASFSLPGAPGGVSYDVQREHLYLAVGDPGTVTVVDTAALALVETVVTDPGAHALGWDLSRILCVFCPARSGATVFTHQDHGS